MRTEIQTPYMECIHVKNLKQPGKSLRTRIGFAFQNHNGSWNLELSTIPADGRIQMRMPSLDRFNRELLEK